MVSIAAREIAKGIVPNALFSALVAWLLFGGERYVAVRTIAIDAAPQSGVIAAVTVVVAAATVARSRSPAMEWLLPILPLAVVVGMVVAVVGAGISLSLLPALAPLHWTIGELLAFKAIYGAAVGAALTIPALWAARRRLHG